MDKKLAASLGLSAFLIVFFALILGMLNFSGKDLSLHQKEKRPLLGAVYMTLNNPFYQVIDNEIRSRIDGHNFVLLSRNPALNPESREFDTSKRKKHLSALVNIAVSLSNFSF